MEYLWHALASSTDILVIRFVILQNDVRSQLNQFVMEKKKNVHLALKPASLVDISSKLFVSCESCDFFFFHCQANFLKWYIHKFMDNIDFSMYIIGPMET